MGFYERTVVPWLVDRAGRGPEADALRAEALAEARGEVLELGFGTGLNVAHYPAAVERVVGVDPNPGMNRRAARRIAAGRVPVELVGVGAEGLPFDAGRFDTVASTLTLCSIPAVGTALAEARRVLKPGGAFLFLEHGLSPDPDVRKWQHRLNGLQKRLAGGCHLDRDIVALIESAGFRLERRRQFYFAPVPRPLGWLTIGRARVA